MRWVCLLLLCSLTCAKAEGMNVYGVILAGGVGERLWPLSRQEHPKQFLSIGSSDNLLQQSINRFNGIIAHDAIWVVTSAAHAQYISDHMNNSVGNLIIEPCGRNTGPALLHACLELSKKDPNAVIVCAPADPYIPDSDYALYRRYISQAIECAASCDTIVLCGVKPTYAATGYGYIEYAPEHTYDSFFQVERFHEKPSFAIAQNYVQQKNMLWNIGTFVAKVSVFIDEFKRVAPDLFSDLEQFHAGKKAYKDIMSQSVDCAVIEKSNRICVLPVDFSWCDVGNVDVFLSLKTQSGQHVQKEVMVNAHNNVVDVPNKLVALIGVDDLCIIETNDALLITKRSEAENVRDIVAQLKKEKQTEYL